MAKPTKRKSEGDLPNDNGKGKDKRRKTANISDISDDAHPEDDSDGLFVNDSFKPKSLKKSKKSRKSEPARQRVDEYEEDTGRTGSQDFLKMIATESEKRIKAAKKNNKYIEKVTNTFEKEEQALKERIQDLSTFSINQNEDFLVALKSAYAASRPQHGPKAFSSLYERSRTMTSNALRIIEEFEKVNNETSAINSKDLMSSEWKGDGENVIKVLEFGRQAGWKKYKALLFDQEEPEVDVEDEQLLNHVYSNLPDGDDLTMGWGKVAKKQTKAVKRMVKASLLEETA